MFSGIVGGPGFREYYELKSPERLRIDTIYTNKCASFAVLTLLLVLYNKGSPEITPVQFISTCI